MSLAKFLRRIQPYSHFLSRFSADQHINATNSQLLLHRRTAILGTTKWNYFAKVGKKPAAPCATFPSRYVICKMLCWTHLSFRNATVGIRSKLERLLPSWKPTQSLIRLNHSISLFVCPLTFLHFPA